MPFPFGDPYVPKYGPPPWHSYLMTLRQRIKAKRPMDVLAAWLAAGGVFITFAALAFARGSDWAGLAILGIGAILLFDPIRRTWPWRR